MKSIRNTLLLSLALGLFTPYVLGDDLSSFLNQAQNVLEEKNIDINNLKKEDLKKLDVSDLNKLKGNSTQIETLVKLCSGKNAAMCAAAGEYYLKHKESIDKALVYLDKACQFKSGEVCAKIAEYYLKGESGIPQNLSKAKEYYEKACSLGIGSSCEGLKSLFK